MQFITIGALAARTGTSVSALRFYEAEGLITAHRSAGNQRRFARADIRRVSFIKIAQGLGLSMAEIARELAALPNSRTPTARDWSAISARLAGRIDAQIARLSALRSTLDGCIGCGCLSLEVCGLWNAADRAAQRGPGPRWALGDDPNAADG
jgi:MerR family transcriptional regulator, redox-sensitive transcriptional activator SoxR